MERQPTVFNSAQLYLLGLFSRIKSDEELNDIKQLVSDYFAKKLDAHLEKLWDEGILDQKKLDEINEMDLHQWPKHSLCDQWDYGEYAEILHRLAGGYTAGLVLNAILESKHVERFTPYYHFNLITADPDDNKFVDCAIQANARYIVTNDHHYDVLRTIDYPVVDIMALKTFSEMLKR